MTQVYIFQDYRCIHTYTCSENKVLKQRDEGGKKFLEWKPEGVGRRGHQRIRSSDKSSWIWRGWELSGEISVKSETHGKKSCTDQVHIPTCREHYCAQLAGQSPVKIGYESSKRELKFL